MAFVGGIELGDLGMHICWLRVGCLGCIGRIGPTGRNADLAKDLAWDLDVCVCMERVSDPRRWVSLWIDWAEVCMDAHIA